MSDIAIRPALPADAGALARIYNHYVKETIVTFEEEEVPEGEMSGRLEEIRGAALPWLVAEQAGNLLGYAYASMWKSRRGYRFTAEVTVYLDPGSGGRGIGSSLYRELLPTVQSCGFHAAIGVIALPNDASVALHEKFGFAKAAHFREVGLKFGRWIDVGYWERIF